MQIEFEAENVEVRSPHLNNNYDHHLDVCGHQPSLEKNKTRIETMKNIGQHSISIEEELGWGATL